MNTQNCEDWKDDLKIVLQHIFDNLYINHSYKPNLDNTTFILMIQIFLSGAMDKMFDFQEYLDIEEEDRMTMAENFGNDLRQLIKKYTNLDTVELIKELV
jgi:hypothetical protein